MDIKNTISSTEARTKFAEVIDNAGNGGARYTLTVNGRPKVVIMSADEFEGWQETIEILSEPGALERIKKSEKQIERGEFVTLEELKRSLQLD